VCSILACMYVHVLDLVSYILMYSSCRYMVRREGFQHVESANHQPPKKDSCPSLGCRQRCDMIYLLTAVGFTPGGSSTVHIYTQTIHRTTQLTTLVGRLSGIPTQSSQRVRAMPHLCELYPGICITTEGKARKNLSRCSRRVPVGTMKTEYTEQNVHNNKNT
jgi:hypothetical protein